MREVVIIYCHVDQWSLRFQKLRIKSDNDESVGSFITEEGLWWASPIDVVSKRLV